MNELFKQYCLRLVGLPYVWGGDDTIKGMDCSGFAQEILEAFGGHPLPGKDLTAQGLYDALQKTGQYNNYGIGALAFYGKDFRRITHVAIVIGPNLIIEAGGGGSKTLTAEDAAAHNAYIRIRPLKRRSDLVACILPKYQ
jgi:cell wall-associated NlpC family hydrolase